MADIGWRRRRGASPAARGGARQRAGLPPASASNTLSCRRETLHSQQLRSIKKSIDSDHGIYRDRTFHGRPAGFRTHSLVCVASALLMLVTVYQSQWMTQTPLDAIRTDPTRMAQGIMTGIGFLGAGVIFKEGLTVRGLTTAASIWITAAIGILVGIGFYFAAVVGTLATLAVLAVFRWIEQMLPAEFYAHHMLRFDRENVIAEEDLR